MGEKFFLNHEELIQLFLTYNFYLTIIEIIIMNALPIISL